MAERTRSSSSAAAAAAAAAPAAEEEPALAGSGRARRARSRPALGDRTNAAGQSNKNKKKRSRAEAEAEAGGGAAAAAAAECQEEPPRRRSKRLSEPKLDASGGGGGAAAGIYVDSEYDDTDTGPPSSTDDDALDLDDIALEPAASSSSSAAAAAAPPPPRAQTLLERAAVHDPMLLVQPQVVPQGIRDIDADARTDPLQVPEYTHQLQAFIRSEEVKCTPASGYIPGTQPHLTSQMRSILVDWLVEVAEEYKLHDATLFLGVNLVDRCLACFEVTRSKLQLVGCGCMLVAAKFEEIYAPNVEDFVYISDNTYTRPEILAMESKVTETLLYKIRGVTPHSFVGRFLKAANSSKKETSFVKFLLELAMQEYSLVTTRPSVIAAAALYLARQTMTPPSGVVWDATLRFYTGYEPEALASTVRTLQAVHVGAEEGNLQAVRTKYNHTDKFFVSHAVTALRATDLTF